MLAIRGARVIPVTSPEFTGVILIDGKKILDLGPDVRIPEGAEVVPGEGLVVTPGLIEAHSHLGFSDAAEDEFFDDFAEEDLPRGGGRLGPSTTPDWDSAYALNPRNSQLKDAMRAGVTTIMTGPGSGKVISGLNLVTKTAGRSYEEMVLLSPAGLKMAFGENPKRNFGQRHMIPSTRMGTASVLRDAFVKAQNYMQRREHAREKAIKEGKEPPAEAPNFQLEPIVKVLKRELKARIHAHRLDDIMTVLRIKDEFNIDMTLEHATEVYKLPEEIKKRNIPCVFGPTWGVPGKAETLDMTFKGARIMEEAGIKMAITTDSPVVGIEYLRLSATLAMKEGMSEKGALRAITITPAEILGVGDRVGSLEKGKDADLVVFDDHPLRYTSAVLMVFIDGVKRYDRATYREPWELEDA